MKKLFEISGNLYVSMLRLGASCLEASKKDVNDLNVFPIPDGDTGDNMFMTIKSGVEKAVASQTSDISISEAAAEVSRGMLLGARGNSGVILSRIFAGLSKGLTGVDKADMDTFCKAWQSGVTEAYSSVSNPVEGTILTVLKDSVKAVSELQDADLVSFLDVMLDEMRASLERTPDLLPVLKEAGVVDSGGAGLLCIVEGMHKAACGEKPSDNAVLGSASVPAQSQTNLDAFGPDTELEFGYCTEFLLRLQTAKVDLDTFDETEIRNYLTGAGDSVVCFREGSIVKVHVHTKTPGDILSHCQKWGEFLTLKIENMTLQHSGVEIKDNFVPKRKKRIGVVSVACGSGICDAMKEAGADCVIEGGQTMNPSVKSFVKAFEHVAAETIFVFPNNSNVILTARQAAELYSGSRIIVIPTKDPGAGYVAIASMDKESKDIDALEQSILETIGGVSTGLVSKAIRNASKDGVDVVEGDYIAICDGKILSDGKSASQLAVDLAGKMGISDHEVALVFTGRDAQDADELERSLSRQYPLTEFIIRSGGQPVFDYIIVLC